MLFYSLMARGRLRYLKGQKLDVYNIFFHTCFSKENFSYAKKVRQKFCNLQHRVFLEDERGGEMNNVDFIYYRHEV